MSTTDAPNDNTVTSLTGDESGRWRVSTRDSTHYFDLDARTMTRVPGTSATPGSNDMARPLRSIDTLTVGLGGRWTMHSDGWSDSINYYWHESSVVVKIEQVISERPA